MPSVKEELEALRKQNLTKKNAENLKDAGPLSTPEAEEAAIQAKLAKNKTATYKKEAQSALHETKATVDQTLEFQMKTGQAKKTDKEKQKEAAQNLQSFNQAKLDTANATKKPTTPAASTPAPAATPNDNDGDDVPNLEEIDDDDDVPNLEEVGSENLPPGMDPAAFAAAQAAANEPHVINRAERKARRMMEKMGMKAVPGISQCTIKMGGRQGFFTITKPDVFEKNGSYVVFGEARQGGGGGAPSVQQQQARAVEKLAAEGVASMESPPQIEEVPDEETEEIDETGVEAKDIELVISQAGCSRAKAVKALKDNDGDLVNAIMSLTS
jgi:nascent polypeptide-associated complex subunit alpha